jgi:integrase/recombinase XerD
MTLALPPSGLDPVAVYAASMPSENSRRACLQAMQRIADVLPASPDARTIPWHSLRFEHTQTIRAKLIERHAPATVRLTLAMLRGVLRTARNLGQLPSETYDRATGWPRLRGYRLPRGRALEPAEMTSLFEAAGEGKPPFPIFATALLSVLAGAGLRRAEVASLEIASYNAGALRLVGKGGKQRSTPLPAWARANLETWIHLRGSLESEGPSLFVRVCVDGRVRRRPLSAQGVRNFCSWIGGRAGIAAFSPHDLRRTFVSTLLEKGVDLATVQRLAGHASPATTAIYDRRGERAAKSAVEQLTYWT